MDEWRAELDGLVSRGRELYGDDRVREVLAGAVEGISSEEAGPLRPVVAVLGVSPCESGWVGVLIRPTGQTSLHIGSRLGALVEQVREQESVGAVALPVSSAEDADPWLRSRPTVEVVEVPLADEQRRSARDSGITVPSMYPGMGFVEDDLLTACAVGVEAALRFS